MFVPIYFYFLSNKNDDRKSKPS